MKHFLNIFILIALLSFAGFSLAEPAVETTAAKPAESVAVEITTTSAPQYLLQSL